MPRDSHCIFKFTKFAEVVYEFKWAWPFYAKIIIPLDFPVNDCEFQSVPATVTLNSFFGCRWPILLVLYTLPFLKIFLERTVSVFTRPIRFRAWFNSQTALIFNSFDSVWLPYTEVALSFNPILDPFTADSDFYFCFINSTICVVCLSLIFQ